MSRSSRASTTADRWCQQAEQFRCTYFPFDSTVFQQSKGTDSASEFCWSAPVHHHLYSTHHKYTYIIIIEHMIVVLHYCCDTYYTVPTSISLLYSTHIYSLYWVAIGEERCDDTPTNTLAPQEKERLRLCIGGCRQHSYDEWCTWHSGIQHTYSQLCPWDTTYKTVV